VEAVADFDEAIRLQPDRAEYFVGRAHASSQLGDLVGAITDLSEAIRLKPSAARLFERRGDVRQRHGELEEAIADFDKAVRLDPELGDAFIGRGCVRWETGDLAGAIADFGEAINLDPEELHALGYRADVRLLNGDAEGALADHDDAVRFNPADIRVYRARATTRETIGDLDGAISDYEKALRLAPGVERHLKALRRRRPTPLKRWRLARRRRQAGHRYLQLADDGNANIETIDQRYLHDGYVPVEVLRQWCADTAPVYEQLADEVRRLPWPPDVQTEADWLAAASSQCAATYDSAARATTGSEALELLHANINTEHAHANAVIALRLALGIPHEPD
jgi:tetratricopeptide (TPR) repeat protein